MRTRRLHNEQELLRLVAEGNEKAFRELFDFYSDRLYTYVLRITNREGLAEEIVMDAFLKIWIKHKNLVGIDRFDSYLFTVVRNQAFNAMKRIARENTIISELSLNGNENNDDTEETVIYNECQRLLDKAVNQLPPQQKLVYILSRDEGLKYDEIAVQLKVSKNTVKSHLKKAISALRTVFTNHVVFILGSVFLF